MLTFVSFVKQPAVLFVLCIFSIKTFFFFFLFYPIAKTLGYLGDKSVQSGSASFVNDSGSRTFLWTWPDSRKMNRIHRIRIHRIRICNTWLLAKNIIFAYDDSTSLSFSFSFFIYSISEFFESFCLYFSFKLSLSLSTHFSATPISLSLELLFFI